MLFPWAIRRSRARRRRYAPGLLVGLGLGAGLVVAVAAPLWAVVDHLLQGTDLWRLIVNTLTNGSVLSALRNTVVLAVAGGVVTTAVATGLAWLVYRTDIPARRALRVLIVVPLFIPVLVTAIAWSLLLGSQVGLLNRGLHSVGVQSTLSVFNFGGVVFVLCLALVPVAFVLVRSAVAEPDAEQEEAALVSGASLPRVTFGVTLPRIMPSIGATALLITVLASANFSVTAVLGLPWRVNTLSTEIFFAFNSSPPDYPEIALMSCLLVILLVVLLSVQFRIERRARAIETRGGGKEAVTWKLGAWRWPAFAAVCLFLVASLILPLAAIVLTSMARYWGAPIGELSLENLRLLFSTEGNLGSAISNTVMFAVVGASAALVVGSFAAYVFRRLRPPGSGVFDTVATSGIAIPGLVIGLGYLWLTVGTPLYGSLTLLIIVVSVQFLPFALRLTSAGLTRLPVSLDEAARVSGAGELRVARDVVIPLLRRTIGGSWILLFLVFSHEIDAIVLIAGPGNSVLASDVYTEYATGYPQLAAMAALVLLVVTAATLLVALALGWVWRPAWTAARRRFNGGLLPTGD
jgi:iron(III) transport system permease protein